MDVPSTELARAKFYEVVSLVGYKHFRDMGLSPQEIGEVEHRLGLSLPKDVAEVLTFYSGFSVSGRELYSWSPTAAGWSVVENTLEMREEGLDERLVVLGLDDPVVCMLDASTGNTYDAAFRHQLELLDPPDDAEITVYESYADFLCWLFIEEIEWRAEIGED